MLRGGPTYDHERVHFNLAKLRKGGSEFEVAIDPDAAIAYREGAPTDLKQILKAEKIFFDVKKGLLAAEDKMQSVFGTTDALTIAKTILDEGEIQLTAEHRQRIRDDKRRRLIEKIHRNAIDPKTGSPHPAKRIELAFEEAKVKVDEARSVDAQLQDIVKALQTVLPLRIERATLRVHLGAQFAQKFYGTIQSFGTIKRDEWLNDGSWVCYVELPAGMQNDLIDELNNRTHGSATIEKVKER